MNKYFLVGMLAIVSFATIDYPEGWTKVGKEKFNGQKFEVYFFDYFSKVKELEPDLKNYKGSQFTDKLENVHFKFPLYVFSTRKEEVWKYYILRPNEAKRGTPNFFDIDIVTTEHEMGLNGFEDRSGYKNILSKTIEAKSCRGELIYEYNQMIQRNPNKNNLIGNGIPITDSIFTRVIPYQETKTQFFKSIQEDL